MSTMQIEVYEAFRSLNVDDDKALKAAAVLGKQGDELASLRIDMDKGFVSARADAERGVTTLRTDMNSGFAIVRSEMDKGFARMEVQFAGLKGEQTLVRWVGGLIITMMTAILFKLFLH